MQRLAMMVLCLGVLGSLVEARTEDFCEGWHFLRDDVADAQAVDYDDTGWDPVVLPHTARIEQFVTTEEAPQWQGICWYRKHFRLSPVYTDKVVWLRFEAAMNVAEVWVNGQKLTQHLGGFLPFVVDLTGVVRADQDNVVAVRLDNRDNPVTGPKPLKQLDFNLYSGLYRKVQLIIKDRLHITDPILADQVASGGVFVTTPQVGTEKATIKVQTHVQNQGDKSCRVTLACHLNNPERITMLTQCSETVTLAAGQDQQITQEFVVDRPRLWSPQQPNLYQVRVDLMEDDRIVDSEKTRFGIRHLVIDPNGFTINGQRMFLRGTNRHQEYPYLGYALSDAAQYRDARMIKEAGFDYIRLSHYPHSPAFMDACDELGLVVMDCIPGWQYMGGPEFQELQYQNCHDMIRRDRNHPCVILWEVSLNETRMSQEFIERTHGIAHAEMPGDQCYTCGWTYGYDVFIQARQHGGCHKVTDRPCLVSEYGDWEYYAQNAGLNQDAWANLKDDDRNSRMLRWHGERALLQQVTNFQEAHNDNRQTSAFADGLWVMFDYNRGYAHDIESSGCVDLARVPKYSYHFFRSQRDASEQGPMVFIASRWQPDSSTTVKVFSNGQEVELRLNDRLIARQEPDEDALSSHLDHPPFTFQVPAFTPGCLQALALQEGKVVATHEVRTPGAVARLSLDVALCREPFCAQGKDAVWAHASLLDKDGMLVSDAWENVWFAVTGDLQLVGMNPFTSEAGISSILVQSNRKDAQGALYALGLIRQGEQWLVVWCGQGINGAAVTGATLHDTTEGGGGVSDWPVVTGPLSAHETREVALVVDGQVLLRADVRTEKYSAPGSVRQGTAQRRSGATTQQIFPAGPAQGPQS